MKKNLLVVMFVLAFCQVKAQQLFPVKPADSLKINPLEKYFKINPGIQQQLFQLQVNPAGTLDKVDPQLKVSGFDHMPIAFLQGNSKMPVAKLNGSEKIPVVVLGGDIQLQPDTKKIRP